MVHNATFQVNMINDPTNTTSNPDFRKKIGSINVINGGSGYLTIPYLSFSTGDGKGAKAIPVMDPDNPETILSVTLLDSGFGYSEAPTLKAIERNDIEITKFKCSTNPIGTASNVDIGDAISQCNNNPECKYAEYNFDSETAKFFNNECTDNYVNATEEINDPRTQNFTPAPEHHWGANENKYTYNKEATLMTDIDWIAEQLKLIIPSSTPIVSGSEFPFIDGLDFFLSSLNFDYIEAIISNADSIYSDIDESWKNNIINILINSKTTHTIFSTHDLPEGVTKRYAIIKNNNAKQICKSFNTSYERDHAFLFNKGHHDVTNWGCYNPIELTQQERNVYDKSSEIINSLLSKIRTQHPDYSEDQHNMLLLQLANHTAIKFLEKKVMQEYDVNDPNDIPPDGYFGNKQNPIDKYRGPCLADINPVNADGDRPIDKAKTIFHMMHSIKGSRYSHCNHPEVLQKHPNSFPTIRVAIIIISFDAVRKHISPCAAYDIIKQYYETTEPEASNQHFKNYDGFEKKKEIKYKNSFTDLPQDLLFDVLFAIKTGKNRSGKKVDKQKLLSELSKYQHYKLKKINYNLENIMKLLSGF